MYYYRRKAMVMSGCNVVQMVENHGEAFGGAISGKKITKRPTCIIEVGTIDVGGL
jgi:predicted outer membrane repeat protein